MIDQEMDKGREMQRIRTKSKSRGAALVEYGLLLGLVAVVAIASVSRLGDQVSATFTDVAEELEMSMGPEPAASGENEPALPPVTFREGGNSGEEMPPYVTKSGKYYYVDLDAIMPDRTLLSSPPRFNATISNAGSFQKRWPDEADSTSSLTVAAFADWVREGESDLHLVAADAFDSPAGFVQAYNERNGGFVPENATSIKLEPRFHCNPGSICEKAGFEFNIDFY
jgi:Flp pilus assembly pilin Flp